MNRKSASALLATASVAAFGLSTPTAQAANLHIFGVPVEKADMACPTKVHKQRVFRMVLKAPLDINAIVRDVREKGFDGTMTDEDNTQGTAVPQPNLGADHPTPLDLDLTAFLTENSAPATTNTVLIKIVVKDHRVKFLRDGWAIGSAARDGMFCGAKLSTNGSGDEVVKFYALYLPHQPRPYLGSFSIGLTSAQGIPFFIDPIIENNGFELAGKRGPKKGQAPYH